MAFTRGQSAVIVPIPAAEPLVRRWRKQFDPAASAGMPAHVTVIYPFLNEEFLTCDVLDDLLQLVAGHPSFSVTFTRCGNFPNVLYLAPDPEAPFRRLTQDLARRWPEAPPYGGRIRDSIPHLTVTHGAPPGQVATAEIDMTTHLPLTARIEQAALITFDGTVWSPRAALPLGKSDA